MLYRYSAVNRGGIIVTGEMEATSRGVVLDDLHKMGHLPVEVTESTRAQSAANGGSGPFKGNPSARQITLFTRELAMLLKAGLPLDQSLGFLEKDARSKRLSRIIGQVAGQVGSGKSLYELLEQQGPIFPPLFVNMVRVAEASGSLDTVLSRIAESREKTQKLQSKALSEMIYPCILVLMAIAAVVVMLTVVVPRFKDMVMHAGTRRCPSRRALSSAPRTGCSPTGK